MDKFTHNDCSGLCFISYRNRPLDLATLGRWTSWFVLTAVVGVLLGCTTATPLSESFSYRFEAHTFAQPDEILAPQDRVAETPVPLIEAALHHLAPSRLEGLDYSAAAMLFLRAGEVANPVEEQDLALAGYRAAARAALRSGDRGVYVRAVEGWSHFAMEHELRTGELAVHRRILARLRGETGDLHIRLPAQIVDLVNAEGSR